MADEDAEVREESALALFGLGLRDPALIELMEKGVRDPARARRSRFESALAEWKKESEPKANVESTSCPAEIKPSGRIGEGDAPGSP